MSIKPGNGNDAQSKVEQLTESIGLRLIARASMIATPVLLAIFGWAAVEVWSVQRAFNKEVTEALGDLKERVITIEVERRIEERERSQSRRSAQSSAREALSRPE